MSRAILGLSAYYHDSAAALVQDGVLVAECKRQGFMLKRPPQTVAV